MLKNNIRVTRNNKRTISLKNQINRIRHRRKYRPIISSRFFRKDFQIISSTFKEEPVYTGHFLTEPNNLYLLKKLHKSGTWKSIVLFRNRMSFWTSYNRRYFSEDPKPTNTKNFGLGVIKSGKIESIESVLIKSKSEMSSLNIYSHKVYPNAKTADINEAFYLCVNGSDQFQHFIQDCLPIITHVKKFLEKHPDLPLIVNRPGADFLNYEYYFNLVGIKNPRTYIEEKSLTIKILYLLDFKPINAIYCLPSEMYRRMFEIVLQNKAYKETEKKNLVCFIRDSKSRNFKNEQLVKQELSKHADKLGLNPFFINPSCIDLNSMIEVLSNAIYIFGAHGGAIYNMVFASPDATLIEFVTTEHADSLSHLILSFGQNYMPYAIPMSKDDLNFSVSEKDFDLIFKILENKRL
jgi:hypothetical protein